MADKNSDDRGDEATEARFARSQEEEGPSGRAAAIRRQMERAALELSGELGYRGMTVAELISRSDSNLDRFYRAYGSKFDCYLVAYEEAIEAFCERLLEICDASPDWPSGMRAALGELARFLAQEPALAKGLFAEVHVAGGAALEKRNEVFERLSRAIDRARRETSGSRHSPPPVTSRFILSAIEAAVVRYLATADREDFAVQVPGLLYLALAPYLGTEVAAREARRVD
jgi:AcrR family transcriptional regulator